MLGLTLSGGGARGISHLGMLEALKEEGIDFDVVAGASAGAIVGSLYCNGHSPSESLEIIKSINFLKILKPALNWRGLLRLDSAIEVVEKYLPPTFSKLAKPLYISTTQLKTGKVRYFSSGNLIYPLLASCSIPVVFDPVMIKDMPYVDGGILDNLPIKPIKKKCSAIVGLHCNPISTVYELTNWKSLMERSFLLSINSVTMHNKKKCTLFFEPPQLANYNVLDFKKADELFNIGYQYIKDKKQIKTIKQANIKV